MNINILFALNCQVYAGAGGKTEAEMKKVLKVSKDYKVSVAQ